MKPPTPLSLPDAWSDIASGYAEELIPTFSLYARDALRLADLPPRAHVLDVAAGPGTLALLAAPYAEHVVAVDFAGAMVGELKRRADAAGAANVEVLQTDGQSLPLEDACFDGAFSMFGLIFFPDRAAGFREMLRVLKPGGRGVVSSWPPMDQVPLHRACFNALGELLPSLPSEDGKPPLGDEREFRSEMVDAGFRNVEIHIVAHRVRTPSVLDFWTMNVRSSAQLALARKQLTPTEWDELGSCVVMRLEQEFGSGPIEMSWPALLGVGVRM